MDAESYGSLAYLGLLGVVIAGFFIVANRHQLGKLLQQGAIWTFIFIGAIIAVGLWSDIRSTVMPQQSVAMAGTQVSVPRSPDGHYYLNLEINGTPTRFMVDTGATDMVLSRRDASLAGLKLDSLSYTTRAMTANGMVQTARVRLDQVALAGIVDLSVSAVVNAGDMGNSLLGMTYLQRFNSIEISGNTLLLTR